LQVVILQESWGWGGCARKVVGAVVQESLPINLSK
jgi:hypothetical protein